MSRKNRREREPIINILAMRGDLQQDLPRQQNLWGSPIHRQHKQHKEQSSSSQLKVSPLPRLQHSLDLYQKRTNIIESTTPPIFKLNRKNLQYPSKEIRIKTDPTPEQDICQPVSTFFQKYITRKIEKRKLRPLSLCEDKEQRKQEQHQLKIKSTKINRLVLDTQNPLKKQLIKLPQKKHLKDRYQKIRLKQSKRTTIRQEITEPFYSLQSRSLELPQRYPTETTPKVFKVRKSPLYSSPSRMKQITRQSRLSGRNQQEEDKGEHLTPWSFDNEYEH